MHIGIIGPQGSGKTTLFRALSALKVERAEARHEPTRAVVHVPDERVDALAEMFQPRKVTYANVEYVDLPNPGASESYPRQYLQHFRTADALAVVLRLYPYPGEELEERMEEAKAEFEELELALILNDLAQVEKKIEGEKKQLKGKKSDLAQVKLVELLERVHTHLEAEKSIRCFELSEQEEKELRGYTFLSQKLPIIILNIDESMIEGRQEIIDAWKKDFPGLEILALPGLIEAEMMELPEEEAEIFLGEYGIEEPALPVLIRACYSALDRISFFTVGEDEVRAWDVKRGTNAQKSAGEIHSDLERGFIRAEVTAYPDLMDCGSLKEAKNKGVLRLEGKEYITQDGDIMHIRFAV